MPAPASSVVLAPLVALIVAAIATAVLLRSRAAALVLDLPNHRSLHAAPTPRIGGIGILAGIIGACAYAGVAVDLPQTKAGALNIDQKPVSVAIDEKGQVFLMDQPIEVDKLLEKLKETAKQGFDERIYVRGSKAVNYGRVAEVMSLITSAGYKKVALVTEQEKK